MSQIESKPRQLQVVQAVCGTFHHFDLARELESRGYLNRIYSTFPWIRLQRESVPHAKVGTFPWIHTPQFVLSRRRLIPARLNTEISLVMFHTFDAWVSNRLPHCDAFIAISGTGLKSGQKPRQWVHTTSAIAVRRISVIRIGFFAKSMPFGAWRAMRLSIGA